MRIADNWKEYRILDTSDGEKLELWNGVSLIRPDPQIIWKTPRAVPQWDTADGHYHRSCTALDKLEIDELGWTVWTNGCCK